MHARKLLMTLASTLALAGAFFSGIDSAAAAGYAKAVKIGKSHAPDCGKNGFNDVHGQCWTCPDGFDHPNLRPADSAKACVKEGKTQYREGHYVDESAMNGCQKGRFSAASGKCFTCPSKEWKNNPARKGSDDKFCRLKEKDKYAKARKQSGDAMCDKGMFALADGGSCWTCPADFPKRTLWGMTSDKACRTKACGGNNEPICSVFDGAPCKSKLTPNYAIGECVSIDARREVCKATLAMFRGQMAVSGAIAEILDEGQKRAERGPGIDAEEVVKRVSEQIDPDTVDEVARLFKVANEKADEVKKQVFDDESFCSIDIREVDRDLKKLGIAPEAKKKSAIFLDDIHFIRQANAGPSKSDFWTISVGVAGHYVIGANVTLTFVTNFNGEGGAFVGLGPELASNLDIGVGVGVQRFGRTTLNNFKGWGWGGSASGGPWKIVSAGVDFSFDEKLKVLQGWGGGVGAGVGVLPLDVSLGPGYSWRLW